MTIKTSNLVTEWNLDSKQHRDSLKKLVSEYDKTSKGISDHTERGERSAKGLGDAFQVFVGTMATRAVSKLGDQLIKIIGEATKFNKVVTSFKGDIEALRQATNGLISDTDLMIQSNQLYTLGVKLTAKEQAELFANVKKLSDAMGNDLTMAMESATTALARQSSMRADNIGVVMKAEEAYRKFASSLGKTADELTALEKREAFQAEFMEQLNAKAGELEAKVTSVADAFTQWYISAKNQIVWLVAEIDKGLIPALEHFTRTLFMHPLAAKRAKAELYALGAEITRLHRQDQEFWRLRAKNMNAATAAVEKYSAMLNKMLLEQLKKKPKKGKKKDDSLPTQWENVWEHQESVLRLEAQVTGYQDIINAVNGLKKLNELQEKHAEITAKVIPDALSKAKLAYKNLSEHQERVLENSKRFLKHLESFSEPINTTKEQISDMLVNAFANLAAGIWSAADAAIQGADSFGMAMLKMTKAVLMGLAQQATILAIMETAKGVGAMFDIYTGGPARASGHFRSAALYGVVAAGAGITALGISAGVSASSGYSSRAAARDSSRASSSKSRSGGSRPTIGRSVKEDNRPIHVNVFLGDQHDPGAALLASKQISVALKRAAA